ncbi:unnamed protein product, partial [Mesorhabditis spiculigera]
MVREKLLKSRALVLSIYEGLLSIVTNCKACKKNIAVASAWFKWTMRGFVYIVLMGYLQLEDRLDQDLAAHGLDLMRQRDAFVNSSNLLLMIGIYRRGRALFPSSLEGLGREKIDPFYTETGKNGKSPSFIPVAPFQIYCQLTFDRIKNEPTNKPDKNKVLFEFGTTHGGSFQAYLTMRYLTHYGTEFVRFC